MISTEQFIPVIGADGNHVLIKRRAIVGLLCRWEHERVVQVVALEGSFTVQITQQEFDRLWLLLKDKG